MVKVVEVVELMTMGGGLVPTCTVCEVYSTIRKYMLVLLDSGVSEQKPSMPANSAFKWWWVGRCIRPGQRK